MFKFVQEHQRRVRMRLPKSCSDGDGLQTEKERGILAQPSDFSSAGIG